MNQTKLKAFKEHDPFLLVRRVVRGPTETIVCLPNTWWFRYWLDSQCSALLNQQSPLL